jgi:hypothetical protein
MKLDQRLSKTLVDLAPQSYPALSEIGPFYSPHSHAVVLINPNQLIYKKNIFLTLKTSVAQAVK